MHNTPVCMAGKAFIMSTHCHKWLQRHRGCVQVRVATVPLQRWRVYTLSIVLSNPSACSAFLEIISPCPEGAAPVGGRAFVDVKSATCMPFSCMQEEVQFYFPESGRFRAPAVSISRKGKPLQTLRLPGMHELEVCTGIDHGERRQDGKGRLLDVSLPLGIVFRHCCHSLKKSGTKTTVDIPVNFCVGATES
jgi:hypothetical protein